MKELNSAKVKKRIKLIRIIIIFVIALVFAVSISQFIWTLNKMKSKLVLGSLGEYNQLLAKEFIKDTIFSTTETTLVSYPSVRYQFKNGFALIVKKYKLNTNKPLTSVVKLGSYFSDDYNFNDIENSHQDDNIFILSSSTNNEISALKLLKLNFKGECTNVIQTDSVLCYHFKFKRLALSHDSANYFSISAQTKNGQDAFIDIAFQKKHDFLYLFIFFEQAKENSNYSSNLLAKAFIR